MAVDMLNLGCCHTSVSVFEKDGSLGIRALYVSACIMCLCLSTCVSVSVCACGGWVYRNVCVHVFVSVCSFLYVKMPSQAFLVRVYLWLPVVKGHRNSQFGEP